MSEPVLANKNSLPTGTIDMQCESLLGTVPGVVYTLDDKGTFTYLSEGSGQMLGFSRDDLVGRHFSAIIHSGDLPSVSREQLLPRFEGIPTGSDRAPKLFDERRSWPRRTNGLQVRLHRKPATSGASGDVLKCKVNASGQYDHANRFYGTVGVIYDPVEEDPKFFTFDSTKKYNAFDLLTHALSHVFSNVFTGIYGNLQLIEMQLEHPEAFCDNIDAIKHSIENAVSLIKKLSGTISAQTSRDGCNIGRILSDEAETILRVPGLAYRCEAAEDLWKLQLDPDYARHIIRAVYFHIARSMRTDSVVDISTCNVADAPVKLPRIDCTYIKVGFTYLESNRVASDDSEEQFSALERIASMALSYELLKKVGGHIAINKGDARSSVDLFLPAHLSS